MNKYITIDYWNIFIVLFWDLIILIFGLWLFKIIWLKYVKFEVIDNDYYSFHPNTSYIRKVISLIRDFNNHEYWLKYYGFDAYIYLFFIKSLAETIIQYLIFNVFVMILFYLWEIVANLDIYQNEILNKSAQINYRVLNIFIYTLLMINFIWEIRKKVQFLYYIHYTAPNKDKGFNYLKLRTIMVKGFKNPDFKGENLINYFNNIFNENGLRSCVYGVKIIPDYTKLLKLQMDRYGFQLQSKLFRLKIAKPLVNFMTQKFVTYNLIIKEKANFEKKIDKIIFHPLKYSNYAFVCFNTFEALSYIISKE